MRSQDLPVPLWRLQPTTQNAAVTIFQMAEAGYLTIHATAPGMDGIPRDVCVALTEHGSNAYHLAIMPTGMMEVVRAFLPQRAVAMRVDLRDNLAPNLDATLHRLTLEELEDTGKLCRRYRPVARIRRTLALASLLLGAVALVWACLVHPSWAIPLLLGVAAFSGLMWSTEERRLSLTPYGQGVAQGSQNRLSELPEKVSEAVMMTPKHPVFIGLDGPSPEWFQGVWTDSKGTNRQIILFIIERINRAANNVPVREGGMYN